jgi:hypothetical protein
MWYPLSQFYIKIYLPIGVHNQESLPLLVQKVCSIHFPCLMFLGYISLQNHRVDKT